jgi:hypothetical protein
MRIKSVDSLAEEPANVITRGGKRRKLLADREAPAWMAEFVREYSKHD